MVRGFECWALVTHLVVLRIRQRQEAERVYRERGAQADGDCQRDRELERRPLSGGEYS